MNVVIMLFQKHNFPTNYFFIQLYTIKKPNSTIKSTKNKFMKQKSKFIKQKYIDIDFVL